MKLVVLFPGVGYHCDKPLLYFSRDIAYEAGYTEIINVTYQNLKTPKEDIKHNKESLNLTFQELYEQTEQVLSQVEWKKYDDILFISKSIGTAVAAAYQRNHNVKCKSVSYTPIEKMFEFEPSDGIAFTGTNDSWVRTESIVRNCNNAQISICVIENANHSLEVDDTIRNLDILKEVMEKTKKYLLKTR